MSSVIPIHLYVTKDGFDNGKYLSDIKKFCDEGISALWLETAAGDDAAFLEKLSSHLRQVFIPVVKDPALIGMVLKSRAAGIAVKPSFAKELTVYRDRLSRGDFDIYLYVEEGDFTAVQGEKRLLTVLKDVEEAVVKLKGLGSHDIFVQINHPDPVINFNMNRYLKKYCPARHVVSPVPCRDKEKGSLVNSLRLGSLFYEKAGDVVLLRLPEGSAYSYDNLKDVFELSKKILGSLRLFPVGYSIISCPTCGRCRMELLNMTEEIDRRLKELEKRYNEEEKRLEDTGGIIVAVMGCNVNGPGEARNADIGIAGRRDKTGIIFKNGKPFKTLPENRLVDELILHTKNLIDERLAAHR